MNVTEAANLELHYLHTTGFLYRAVQNSETWQLNKNMRPSASSDIQGASKASFKKRIKKKQRKNKKKTTTKKQKPTKTHQQTQGKKKKTTKKIPKNLKIIPCQNTAISLSKRQTTGEKLSLLDTEWQRQHKTFQIMLTIEAINLRICQHHLGTKACLLKMSSIPSALLHRPKLSFHYKWHLHL